MPHNTGGRGARVASRPVPVLAGMLLLGALAGCGGGPELYPLPDDGSTGGAGPRRPVFNFDQGVFVRGRFVRAGVEGAQSIVVADSGASFLNSFAARTSARLQDFDRFIFVPYRKPVTELIADSYEVLLDYEDGQVRDTVQVSGTAQYDDEDERVPYIEERTERGLDYDVSIYLEDTPEETYFLLEGAMPSAVRGRPDNVSLEITETVESATRTTGLNEALFEGQDGGLVAWSIDYQHTVDPARDRPTRTDEAGEMIYVEADGYWVFIHYEAVNLWGEGEFTNPLTGETSQEWLVVSFTETEYGLASDGTAFTSVTLADGSTETEFYNEHGRLELIVNAAPDGSQVWRDATGRVILVAASEEEADQAVWTFDAAVGGWGTVDPATFPADGAHYRWDRATRRAVRIADDSQPAGDGFWLRRPELGGWVWIADGDEETIPDAWVADVPDLWPDYEWDASRREPVLLGEAEWPSGDGQWLAAPELPGWVWVRAGDLGTVPPGWRPAPRGRRARAAEAQRVSRLAPQLAPAPRGVRRTAANQRLVAAAPREWSGRPSRR